VSDQDFFFDEDEQPKKAEKASGGSKATSKPSASAAAAPAAQSVSMTVAALIGVIALLAGLIVGILLPIGGTTAPAEPTVTAPTGQAAPQLSPEQMQGGELPEGHPDIGGAAPDAEGSGEASATEGE